ncbi:hypothetical protein FIA71_024905 (plasmid) [Escherichia coli]|uniref:hypothetical protein n=1 Tax=Escherichia coli TaxID=562 RepID=UPI00286EDE22|nr:hypothetical protein [Escherichia coli]
MKNEHEDPGSFGETTTPASGKSFLKRQYMGYSLPVWAAVSSSSWPQSGTSFCGHPQSPLQMQASLSHRPQPKAGQSPCP